MKKIQITEQLARKNKESIVSYAFFVSMVVLYKDLKKIQLNRLSRSCHIEFSIALLAILAPIVLQEFR